MSETLRLARTLGAKGWQVWHAEGDSFVLAALGTCFLQPLSVFTLRGLWRLARVWRRGFRVSELRALRLALCMDTRARLGGLVVDIALVAAARAPGELVESFRVSVRSLRRRQRDRRLPAPPPGCAWTVLRLGPQSEAAFVRMARTLATQPSGTLLQIQLRTRRSQAPDTLRLDFPLRIDGLLEAGEGFFPLVRELRVAVSTPRP